MKQSVLLQISVEYLHAQRPGQAYIKAYVVISSLFVYTQEEFKT